MSNPKISVVINTYNEKPSWLRAAVRSYKAQKDVIPEIIISAVKGDPNVRLIEQIGCKVVINDTPGVYKQIIEGLKHVTSEYVCYASSNDFAADFKLRMEYDHCVKHNKKVCFSSFHKCDANLRPITTVQAHHYDYATHLKGNFVSDCALVQTALIEKYGLKLEWGNMAFYDLWLRIYEGEGDVFINNRTPTWFYRAHEGLKMKRQRSHVLIRENRESRERMLAWHKENYVVGRGVTFRKTMFDDVTVLWKPNPIFDAPEGNGNLTEVVDLTEGETHFVYVYVASPARWNELAISVQSIRKHFQGNAKFFCVGDAPGIKDVVHIPVAQVKGRGSKPRDAVVKLQAICDCPLINEDFIYCYDDVILLRPITEQWFDKVLANDFVKDYAEHWKGAKGIIPDQGWRSLFLKTFALLAKKHLPTYNFESHLPRLMRKTQIRATFDKFGIDICGDALFSSLHYNLHYAKPDILLKENNRIKCGLHRAYDRPERIIEEMKGRVWLNYSDPAVNEVFKKTVTKIIKGEVKV